jgi:hypothetical protein
LRRFCESLAQYRFVNQDMSHLRPMLSKQDLMRKSRVG